jgi:hypothetical protein
MGRTTLSVTSYYPNHCISSKTAAIDQHSPNLKPNSLSYRMNASSNRRGSIWSSTRCVSRTLPLISHGIAVPHAGNSRWPTSPNQSVPSFYQFLMISISQQAAAPRLFKAELNKERDTPRISCFQLPTQGPRAIQDSILW